MSFRYNKLQNARIIFVAFCNFAMYDYDSHLCEGDHLGKSRVWGAAYSPFIFYSSKLDKTLHSCDKCDSTFAAIATLRRHNCITRSRGGIKSNVFSLLLSIHVHLTKHDVSFASCGAKSKRDSAEQAQKNQEIPSSQSSDWFRKGLLSDQIEQREEFTSSVIAGTILAFSISVSRGARLNLCGFYNICTFMEMVSQVYGRSSLPQNIYGPG